MCMPLILKTESKNQKAKHLITYYPFLEVHFTLPESQVFGLLPVSHNLTANTASSFKKQKPFSTKTSIAKSTQWCREGRDTKTESESTQRYPVKRQKADDTN